MEKTKIIAFEGADGCGKSTQIITLKNYLEKEGARVKNLKAIYKPYHLYGFKCLNANVRRIIMALEYYDYYKEEFSHADEYDYLICDRSKLGLLAYGKTHGATNLDDLYEIISRIQDPDTLFLLEQDVKTSLERIKNDKTRDGFDVYETEKFITEVKDNYHSVAEQYNINYIPIDSNKSKEEVFEKILTYVRG